MISNLIELTFKVMNVGVRSVNLTWEYPVGDAPQVVLLTISHGSSNEIMSLNESYYHFTAPEDAPSCEVYNFSVAEVGCSVPSVANKIMLPSLPSIERLSPLLCIP